MFDLPFGVVLSQLLFDPFVSGCLLFNSNDTSAAFGLSSPVFAYFSACSYVLKHLKRDSRFFFRNFNASILSSKTNGDDTKVIITKTLIKFYLSKTFRLYVHNYKLHLRNPCVKYVLKM